MTNKDVEKIIDYFADKTLSAGCRYNPPNSDAVIHYGYDHPSDIGKIIGHPVMIGDVLEKMAGEIGIHCDESGSTPHELLSLWQRCGFTKSLNQIAECGYLWCDHEEGWPCTSKCWNEPNLKDSHANALFEFLNTLITN